MENTFCSAPWRHVFVDPDGTLKTCCSGLSRLGNINTAPISQLLTNPELHAIRESILKGEFHENCRNCAELEAKGAGSERLGHQIKELPDLDQLVPRSVDIRWSNTCNLSCRYCNQYYSSIWERLGGSVEFRGMPFSRESSEGCFQGFKDWLWSHAPDLKNVWLLGGEPLMMRENQELLERISPEVEINILTNLSMPDLNKSRIWRLLMDRPNINWRISFENTGDRFEYVRAGAKWSTFCNNLDSLAALPKANINTASTYTVFSAFGIEDFHQFCAERRIKVWWSALRKPDQLDASRLPIDLRSEAAAEIRKTVLRFRGPAHDTKKLLDMASTLETGDENLDGLKSLQQFLDEQEKILGYERSYKELWSQFR
jgi:radical SAM protein with 4Fe4S-binding SPASM domain